MPRKKKSDGDIVPYIVPDEKKAYEAHKLRIKGVPWDVIAPQVGFSSAAEASNKTGKYLTKLTAIASKEQRAESLTLELVRLDQLQESIWDSAVGGDMQAIDRVLKVMDKREKLLGLDITNEKTTGNQTILVMGDSTQYIQRLREVSGDYVDGEVIE